MEACAFTSQFQYDKIINKPEQVKNKFCKSRWDKKKIKAGRIITKRSVY